MQIKCGFFQNNLYFQKMVLSDFSWFSPFPSLVFNIEKRLTFVKEKKAFLHFKPL